MHEPEKAKKIANKTLTGALEKIDDLAEDEFKDTKIIIDLIKENLQIWNEPQKDSWNLKSYNLCNLKNLATFFV